MSAAASRRDPVPERPWTVATCMPKRELLYNSVSKTDNRFTIAQ